MDPLLAFQSETDYSGDEKGKSLMPRRLYLALHMYSALNYSWRLAWHLATHQQA